MAASGAIDPLRLHVNGSLGRLEGVKRLGPKLIIHIRDAHTNPSAQRNIASLISELHRQYGVSTVFLEGGTRDDSLGHLAGVSPLELRRRTANSMLLSGELSGAEYLSLTEIPQLVLYGVEDKALYDRSLRRYTESARTRETALLQLSEIRRRISSLKQQLYPPSLLELDEAATRFRLRQSSFTDYFNALNPALETGRVNRLAYPEWLMLGRLREQEAQVDFAAAQKELVQRLATRSDASYAPARLEKMKPGGLAERQWLEAVLNESDQPAPALEQYLATVREFSKLNLEALLTEAGQLEAEIIHRSLETGQARRLYRIDRHLERLEALLKMTVTRSEFDALQAQSKDIQFRLAAIIAFINRLLADAGRYEQMLEYRVDVDRARASAEAFYFENDRRDEAMVRHALARMHHTSQHTAVLIAGGFHTENLKELFRRQGVSYAVVAPAVDGETNHRRYERLLMEEFGAEQTGGVERRPASALALRPVLERPLAGARLARELGQKAGRPDGRLADRMPRRTILGVALGGLRPAPAQENGERAWTAFFQGPWSRFLRAYPWHQYPTHKLRELTEHAGHLDQAFSSAIGAFARALAQQPVPRDTRQMEHQEQLWSRLNETFLWTHDHWGMFRYAFERSAAQIVSAIYRVDGKFSVWLGADVGMALLLLGRRADRGPTRLEALETAFNLERTVVVLLDEVDALIEGLMPPSGGSVRTLVTRATSEQIALRDRARMIFAQSRKDWSASAVRRDEAVSYMVHGLNHLRIEIGKRPLADLPGRRSGQQVWTRLSPDQRRAALKELAAYLNQTAVSRRPLSLVAMAGFRLYLDGFQGERTPHGWAAWAYLNILASRRDGEWSDPESMQGSLFVLNEAAHQANLPALAQAGHQELSPETPMVDSPVVPEGVFPEAWGARLSAQNESRGDRVRSRQLLESLIQKAQEIRFPLDSLDPLLGISRWARTRLLAGDGLHTEAAQLVAQNALRVFQILDEKSRVRRQALDVADRLYEATKRDERWGQAAAALGLPDLTVTDETAGLIAERGPVILEQWEEEHKRLSGEVRAFITSFELTPHKRDLARRDELARALGVTPNLIGRLVGKSKARISLPEINKILINRERAIEYFRQKVDRERRTNEERQQRTRLAHEKLANLLRVADATGHSPVEVEQILEVHERGRKGSRPLTEPEIESILSKADGLAGHWQEQHRQGQEKNQQDLQRAREALRQVTEWAERLGKTRRDVESALGLSMSQRWSFTSPTHQPSAAAVEQVLRMAAGVIDDWSRLLPSTIREKRVQRQPSKKPRPSPVSEPPAPAPSAQTQEPERKNLEPQAGKPEDSWNIRVSQLQRDHAGLSDALVLKASEGESGGEVLRTSALMAGLLGLPVILYDIRGKRMVPGLRRVHAATLDLLAGLGGIRLVGNEPLSSIVALIPDGSKSSTAQVDLERAGSHGVVAPIVTSAVPAMAFGSGPTSLTLRGRTHSLEQMPLEYAAETLPRLFEKMGLEFRIDVRRYGYGYGQGTGEAVVHVTPLRQALAPVHLTERGALKTIRIIVRTSAFERAALTGLLREISRQFSDYSYRIEWDDVTTRSSGDRAITVMVIPEYEHVTPGGFDGFTRDLEQAYALVRSAAHDFRQFHRSQAVLDPHGADALVPLMALAKGRSVLYVSHLTEHLTTNMRIIEKFLPMVRFKVTGYRTYHQIEVGGIGLLPAGARLAGWTDPKRQRVLAINFGDLARTGPESSHDPIEAAHRFLTHFSPGVFGAIYFYGRGIYPVSESSTLVHRVGQPELQSDPRVHHRVINGEDHYFIYLDSENRRERTVIHVYNYRTKRERVSGKEWTDYFGNNFSIMGMDRISHLARGLAVHAQDKGLDVWYDFIPWLAPERLTEKTFRWAREYRDWRQWPELNQQFRQFYAEQTASNPGRWCVWLEDQMIKNDGYAAKIFGKNGSEYVVLVRHVGGMGGANADQVDLDARNPHVQRYWIAAARRLKRAGASGARVDLAENLLWRGGYSSIRDIVRSFKEKFDPSRRVVTEGYGFNREPLARDGSDGVYYSNLFETYLDFANHWRPGTQTAGKPASIFHQPVLDAIREGETALIYPSNFDQSRLAALGGPVKTYVLLTAVTAHLAGGVWMADAADLLGMTGHYEPIAGGTGPVREGHAHPFDGRMAWMGNPEGFADALSRAPIGHSLESFLRQLGPAPADRSTVQIWPTEWDHRYLALVWPDAGGSQKVLVLDFEPALPKGAVRVFVPDPLKSQMGWSELSVQFTGSDPYALRGISGAPGVEPKGARLAGRSMELTREWFSGTSLQRRAFFQVETEDPHEISGRLFVDEYSMELRINRNGHAPAHVSLNPSQEGAGWYQSDLLRTLSLWLKKSGESSVRLEGGDAAIIDLNLLPWSFLLGEEKPLFSEEEYERIARMEPAQRQRALRAGKRLVDFEARVQVQTTDPETLYLLMTELDNSMLTLTQMPGWRNRYLAALESWSASGARLADAMPMPFSHVSRDGMWAKLRDNPDSIHDVFVMGGGIVGASAAREASLRGYSVVLAEKGSFAEGTSSRSTKLIHAGIRYLELAWEALVRGDLKEFRTNIGLVWHASRERTIWETTAPDLVAPVPIYIPSYRGDRRSLMKVLAGVMVYSLFALRLRWPEFDFTGARAQARFPDLNSEGLRGGFFHYDAMTDDALLVRRTMRDAFEAGAMTLPFVEVLGYSKTPEGLYEVRLKERFSGDVVTLRARQLVDATGPWIDQTRRLGKEEASRAFVKKVRGTHLNVANPKLVNEFSSAFLVMSKDSDRVFFVIPRVQQGVRYLRIGTTEAAAESPEDAYPTPDEVAEIVREFNHFFPKLSLKAEDILSADAGIRPIYLTPGREGQSMGKASREHRIERTPDGVLHAVGVKLTDGRRAGEEIADHIRQELGQGAAGRSSRSTALRQSAADRRRATRRPGEPLRFWIEDLVNDQMLLSFSDLMFRHGGELVLREPQQVADAFGLLANLLRWSRARQDYEYKQYAEERAKRLAAVYEWSKRGGLSEGRLKPHLVPPDHPIDWELLRPHFPEIWERLRRNRPFQIVYIAQDFDWGQDQGATAHGLLPEQVPDVTMIPERYEIRDGARLADQSTPLQFKRELLAIRGKGQRGFTLYHRALKLYAEAIGLKNPIGESYLDMRGNLSVDVEKNILIAINYRNLEALDRKIDALRVPVYEAHSRQRGDSQLNAHTYYEAATLLRSLRTPMIEYSPYWKGREGLRVYLSALSESGHLEDDLWAIENFEKNSHTRNAIVALARITQLPVPVILREQDLDRLIQRAVDLTIHLSADEGTAYPEDRAVWSRFALAAGKMVEAYERNKARFVSEIHSTSLMFVPRIRLSGPSPDVGARLAQGRTDETEQADGPDVVKPRRSPAGARLAHDIQALWKGEIRPVWEKSVNAEVILEIFERLKDGSLVLEPSLINRNRFYFFSTAVLNAAHDSGQFPKLNFQTLGDAFSYKAGPAGAQLLARYLETLDLPEAQEFVRFMWFAMQIASEQEFYWYANRDKQPPLDISNVFSHVFYSFVNSLGWVSAEQINAQVMDLFKTTAYEMHEVKDFVREMGGKIHPLVSGEAFDRQLFLRYAKGYYAWRAVKGVDLGFIERKLNELESQISGARLAQGRTDEVVLAEVLEFVESRLGPLMAAVARWERVHGPAEDSSVVALVQEMVDGINARVERFDSSEVRLKVQDVLVTRLNDVGRLIHPAFAKAMNKTLPQGAAELGAQVQALRTLLDAGKTDELASYWVKSGQLDLEKVGRLPQRSSGNPGGTRLAFSSIDARGGFPSTAPKGAVLDSNQRREESLRISQDMFSDSPVLGDVMIDIQYLNSTTLAGWVLINGQRNGWLYLHFNDTVVHHLEWTLEDDATRNAYGPELVRAVLGYFQKKGYQEGRFELKHPGSRAFFEKLFRSWSRDASKDPFVIDEWDPVDGTQIMIVDLSKVSLTPSGARMAAASDSERAALRLADAIKQWASSLRVSAGDHNWSRRIVIGLDEAGLPEQVLTGESSNWSQFALGGYQARVSLKTGRVRFVQYHEGRGSLSLDQQAALTAARDGYNKFYAHGWLADSWLREDGRGARLSRQQSFDLASDGLENLLKKGVQDYASIFHWVKGRASEHERHYLDEVMLQMAIELETPQESMERHPLAALTALTLLAWMAPAAGSADRFKNLQSLTDTIRQTFSADEPLAVPGLSLPYAQSLLVSPVVTPKSYQQRFLIRLLNRSRSWPEPYRSDFMRFHLFQQGLHYAVDYSGADRLDVKVMRILLPVFLRESTPDNEAKDAGALSVLLQNYPLRFTRRILEKWMSPELADQVADRWPQTQKSSINRWGQVELPSGTAWLALARRQAVNEPLDTLLFEKTNTREGRALLAQALRYSKVFRRGLELSEQDAKGRADIRTQAKSTLNVLRRIATGARLAEPVRAISAQGDVRYHETWLSNLWEVIFQGNGNLRVGTWITSNKRRAFARGNGMGGVALTQSQLTPKMQLVFDVAEMRKKGISPILDHGVVYDELPLSTLTAESKRELMSGLIQLAETNAHYPIHDYELLAKRLGFESWEIVSKTMGARLAVTDQAFSLARAFRPEIARGHEIFGYPNLSDDDVMRGELVENAGGISSSRGVYDRPGPRFGPLLAPAEELQADFYKREETSGARLLEKDFSGAAADVVRFIASAPADVKRYSSEAVPNRKRRELGLQAPHTVRRHTVQVDSTEPLVFFSKEFKGAQGLSDASRELRAAIAVHALDRGPETRLFTSGDRSWLVMRNAGEAMDWTQTFSDPARAKSFAYELGRLVAELHTHSIYHEDLVRLIEDGVRMPPMAMGDPEDYLELETDHLFRDPSSGRLRVIDFGESQDASLWVSPEERRIAKALGRTYQKYNARRFDAQALELMREFERGYSGARLATLGEGKERPMVIPPVSYTRELMVSEVRLYLRDETLKADKEPASDLVSHLGDFFDGRIVMHFHLFVSHGMTVSRNGGVVVLNPDFGEPSAQDIFLGINANSLISRFHRISASGFSKAEQGIVAEAVVKMVKELRPYLKSEKGPFPNIFGRSTSDPDLIVWSQSHNAEFLPTDAKYPEVVQMRSDLPKAGSTGARLGLDPTAFQIARAHRSAIGRGPITFPVAVTAGRAVPFVAMTFAPGEAGSVKAAAALVSGKVLKDSPDVLKGAKPVFRADYSRADLLGQGADSGQLPSSISHLPSREFPGQVFARLADVQASGTAALYVDMNELLKSNGRLKSPRETQEILQVLSLSLAYHNLKNSQLKLVLFGDVSPDLETLVQKTLASASGKVEMIFANTAGFSWGEGGLPEALQTHLASQGLRITKALGVVYGPQWEPRLGSPREMAYVRTTPSDETSAYSILVALAAGKEGKVERLPDELRMKIASVALRAGRLVIELVPTPIVDFALYLADLSRRTTQTSA